MLQELQRDFTAASAAGNNLSLVKTWYAFHADWYGAESEPLPVTVDSLMAVSSLFKRSGYRSFPNYLSAIKAQHILRKFTWTQILDLVGRWCTKSVLRGIGPARQSAAIDLMKVARLVDVFAPLVLNGPVHGRTMFILSAQFMLRELEVSVARVAHWTFNLEDRTITWELPSSKTDVLALGCRRTWGCLCAVSSVFPCPFHLALCHAEWLEEKFKPTSAEWPCVPLFPKLDGTVALKAKVVETFEALATQIGQPLVVNGSRAIGGHSARVTGAQFWAGVGLETPKIAILARWAGDTVFRYVAEAPLRAITDDIKRTLSAAVSSSDGSKEVTKLSERFCKVELLCAQLAEAVQRREVLPISDAPVGVRSTVAPRQFVINTRSSKVHEVWVDDGDPDESRTVCSWRFRKSDFEIVSEVPDTVWVNLCEKCLTKERTELMLQQGYGSDEDTDVDD